MRIVRYETTPNPNAMKCWVDRAISDRPLSYLNAEMAANDPTARAIFEQTGATTLLFNGDWFTINKPPGADWSTIKRRLAGVLSEFGE